MPTIAVLPGRGLRRRSDAAGYRADDDRHAHDSCGDGGSDAVACAGAPTRAPVKPIRTGAAPRQPLSRHSHAPRPSSDLSDLPAETALEIIHRQTRQETCAMDFELMARNARIGNVMLTGTTTDLCLHTTMRETNDRGVEYLLIAACCGATDPGNHASIRMIVASAAACLESLP